ncbi:MAG: response regulator transcription factor [Alphaproteobacteria bacterium]
MSYHSSIVSGQLLKQPPSPIGALPYRVLIIEPDRITSRLTAQHLREECGWNVSNPRSFDEALDRLQRCEFDAVVMEFSSSLRTDDERLEQIKRLRAITTAPLIITSYTKDKENIVKSLNAGADEYIGKPYHIAVLAARLRVFKRRGPTSYREPQIQVTDRLTVDLNTREVKVDGNVLHFTDFEFRIFEALLCRRGNCVPRYDVARKICTRGDDSDNLVSVEVGRIRKKLSAVLGNDEGRRIIQTERGLGFRVPDYEELMSRPEQRRPSVAEANPQFT